MQYPVHRKQDCQNLNLGHGIPPTILCSSNMHQELASAKRILSFEARSVAARGNLHRKAVLSLHTCCGRFQRHSVVWREDGLGGPFKHFFGWGHHDSRPSNPSNLSLEPKTNSGKAVVGNPCYILPGAVIWTPIATVERNWNITPERMPGVSRESYATSILNLKHFTWWVFGRQSINLHLEYVDPISWSTLRWQGAIPKLG